MNKFILTLAFSVTSLCTAMSQYEWIHTDGPEGSLVSFLYSNDSYVFAPEDDFLFRSPDGINWEKLEVEVSSSWSLDNNQIINLFGDIESGLMKIRISEDNGESWTVKDVHPDITYHGGIAQSSHGIYISLGNYSLLFKSVDNGDSWMSVTPPFQYGHTLWTFDDKVYLNNTTNLWHTDENGENWTDISPPVQEVGDYISDLIVKDNYIFITGTSHVFYSHDAGESWNHQEIEWSNSLYKLASTNEAIYLYSKNIYRSTDWGESWEIISTPDQHPTLLTFTGFGSHFLGASYNKGVYRWDENTSSMVANNNGLTKGLIYDMALGNEKIWAACGDGIYAYDLPNESWGDKIDLPFPSFQYPFIDANDSGWVVTKNDYAPHFFFSKDDGIHWDTLFVKTDDYLHHIEKVSILNNKLFAFNDGSVLSSTDEGESWEALNIYSVDHEITVFNDLHFIAGNNKIYRSNNMGESWTEQPIPFSILSLNATEDYLYALTFSENSYYATLYISSDGISWEESIEGLPPLEPLYILEDLYSVYFFQDNESIYTFWGSFGLFVLTNGMQSWSPLLPDFSGNAFLNYNNTIYVGDEGMYKSDIQNPLITHSSEVTSSFDPINIYPNPAQDKFFINTGEDLNGTGYLYVYNTDGTLIKSIFISNLEHPIMIDYLHLSAGAYFLKLGSDKHFKIGKLVIH